MITKTRSISEKEIVKKWLIVDASNVRLGKLATKCASLLLGKHKVTKVDYLDAGDNVIVINAGNIEMHPRKETKKLYYSHSGYPSGLKVKTFLELKEKNPSYIIREAVWGMLPNNKLRHRMITRLFVYSDAEHPYAEKFSTNK